MAPCDHPPACPPECDHCLAFDRLARSLCSRAPASPGSKWCSVHEELQAKLLKSYKRISGAVDAFDNTLLPSSLNDIFVEEDLAQLRTWSENVRAKYTLVRRAVQARDEHHRTFYQGGDWGHSLFIKGLKSESIKLEDLLRELDRRAYTLTLARSKAEWVLSTPQVGFICDEPDDTNMELPLTPPSTPPTVTMPLSKTQRKKANRRAARKNSLSANPDDEFWQSNAVAQTSRNSLTADAALSRIRDYLVPPPELPSTIRQSTWIAVVSILIRQVVLRVPSLATLALDTSSSACKSIECFLDCLEERLAASASYEREVLDLWRGLKFARLLAGGGENVEEGFLGVGVLADAIGDVEQGDEGERGAVELLGGKVFQHHSTAPLSEEGWALFYQFIGCSGCAISVTRTYRCFSRNRQLALLGAFPGWLALGESAVEHALRAVGIHLSSTNASTCGKKIKRVEEKDPSGKRRQGRKTVVVEEWERAWMYCKLPVNTEETERLLTTWSTTSDIVLLAKDLRTGVLTHRPKVDEGICRTSGCQCSRNSELWLSRVRSGCSPSERRLAKWTTSTYFPAETALDSFRENSSPERRFGQSFLDVHDVLLIDNRGYHQAGDWKSFSERVAASILDASSCLSLRDLIVKKRSEAVQCGRVPESDGEQGVLISSKDRHDTGVIYAAFAEKLKGRSMFREKLE